MGVGAGLYMYDVVVKKFTFAISFPDEFLLLGSCIATASFVVVEQPLGKEEECPVFTKKN